MSDDVNIKISATDNATATLRAVQAQLNSFSSSIKAIAGTAIAGFGLRELSSFLGDSLKAYGESERAVTMLDRVLKSTGNTIKMTRKEIQDYANTRMSQTTFDDDAIVEAASHLARFRDLSGETFTQTLDAAQDLATVMGTDLVSATQMLGRAMSSPADGMAKLARAGVLFTDSQKEQIKTLDLIGDKAGQQKIILEELRRQFGGAAVDDASTAAGQIAKLNVQIGNLKEAIGEKLAPTVRSLLEVINKSLGGRIGASGEAQALLDQTVGRPAKDADSAKQRLVELVEAYNKTIREDQAIIRETTADGYFWSMLSPLKLGSNLAKRNSNETARADLKEQIAIARSILQYRQDHASEQVGNSAISGAVRAAATMAFREIAMSAGGATAGMLSGMLAANAAQNAGAAVGQQIRGMFFGQNWWQQQQQQQQDRSLAATESRFLTRGRGQMSPGEQKQIEIEQKQLTVLERMERAFAALDDGMLLHVSGVN